MAISRTYQWKLHPTADPDTDAVNAAADSAGKFTSGDADVGKYLHLEETVTNSVTSRVFQSNVLGPIQNANEVYTPSMGTIAPLYGTAVGGRPLFERIQKRSEIDILDGEISSMAALHSLIHAATPSMTAVVSGRWSDPATWGNTYASANGGFPSTDGITVHIPGGIRVTYDVVGSTAKIKFINAHGELTVDRTKDLMTLYVDTIHTGPGGKVDFGNRYSYLAESATPGRGRFEVIYHRLDAPGSSTRLGMMTMGEVTIHGAPKADKIEINDVQAGATQATIKAGQSGHNLQVGDWVNFLSRDKTGFGPDPQYTGPTVYYERNPDPNHLYTNDPNGFKLSHDELRQITEISGTTIKWATPLQYAHVTRTTTLNLPKNPVTTVPGFVGGQKVSIGARITVLSCSVRFRSDSANGSMADNQNRAHHMFMASDRVDCRYAEAMNMARTDTNPTLFISEPKYNPAYPAVFDHTTIYSNPGLTVDLGNPLNVRGRYAWHMHGGAFGDAARLNRNMNVFHHLTAWAPQDEVPQPGWAITHHNSRLSITNCVVYNVRGAGIVSEIGSEIGQWLDNTVSWCRGDGWPPHFFGRQREQPNHNGHAGVAYENQSRAILQHNNEFTSCRIGWLYEAQTQLTTHGVGLPKGQDHTSLRHFNPIGGSNGGYDRPDRDSYGKASAQIPDLNFCTGVDFDIFFQVAHRVEILRADPTAMIAVGWKGYGGNHMMFIDNYSYKYFFRDFAMWNGNGGAAVFLGTRSAIFGFKNGIVEGYQYLADPGGQGNYGPGWIDIATTAQEGDPNPQGIKNSDTFPGTAPSFTLSTAVSGYKLNLEPGQSYLRFTGKITDGYSANRHWPEFQEPGPAPTDQGTGYALMQVESQRMEDLVIRNGCYQVGGNWFMPAWYSTVNWGNFTHFVFKIDHPLTGNWDPAFLAANTVDPVAVKPVYPLLPEDINKPWPTVLKPENSVAPFIYGRPIVGEKVAVNFGKWTNSPDWPGFAWKRNAAAYGVSDRVYTVAGADIGMPLTVDTTLYNMGGKTTLTTPAVTPKAAYTGPTPQQIFGSSLKDFWRADDPDSSVEIYSDGSGQQIKAPGLAMNSWRLLHAWGGNVSKTQLNQYNSEPNVKEHGWGPDRTRLVDFEPDGSSPWGFLYKDQLGSGQEPIHLFVVVQRSANNQTNANAPMVRAAGHSTMLSTEAAQNVIYNDAGGNVRSVSALFPKGGRGVVYHARNSQGSHSGFNNVRSTIANGGPPAGMDRRVDFGYGATRFGIKEIYWVNADVISTQQYNDMQAYLAYMNSF